MSNPQTPAEWLTYAKEKEQSGDEAGAKHAYRRLIRNHPNSPEAAEAIEQKGMHAVAAKSSGSVGMSLFNVLGVITVLAALFVAKNMGDTGQDAFIVYVLTGGFAQALLLFGLGGMDTRVKKIYLKLDID